MKRVVLALVALLLAPAAHAHPLGNFTINHLSRVSVSSDRVEVTYLLDQAEIPTFQERGLPPATVLARKRSEALRKLVLTVNGRRVPLATRAGGSISYPPGQGGLKLTRVQLPLAAQVHEPRSVSLRDDTFGDRLGWREIVSAPGSGTAVRSTAPSGDPTDGLRAYPKDLLKSPLDERSASFTVRPGHGTLVAPRAPGGRYATSEHASGDGFAGVFADAASGKGVLLLLLLTAFGWGALHALSPGHGKTMVAAFLVGTRGTARHAVALGATVTITHTIGVFALGLVTLALSQYVLPEQLYPWLTLSSGLLVVIVGVNVLRSRIRAARAAHQHHHHHHHDDLTWRSLVGMGASAGLIPCPSALVVLLGAISQHQVGLGLLLILAFSLGLAMTLTALGVGVVYAGRLTSRLSFSGRVATVLPSLSALLIVGLGLMLTLRAVPKVM
ncbi:MAG: nickel/cobalt transporter [Gaiellaceae bacterium]